VKRGDHRPPACEHGEWEFAGSDTKRGRSKWRCPGGECKPGSRWIKADRLHPLVPRESKRWKSLYRARAAVEREFGRLKNEWPLLPLRVRGIERVRLHADLTILAKLAARWRGRIPWHSPLRAALARVTKETARLRAGHQGALECASQKGGGV
jgi:Transposase DDE domain